MSRKQAKLPSGKSDGLQSAGGKTAGRFSTGRLIIWSAIPMTALALILLYRFTAGAGYPLDDSWIHLAFARHLAEGDGFGINPGQMSTGSTAPLWTLLLSTGYLLGAGHKVWPALLGFFCLAGAGVAGALVMQRLLSAFQVFTTEKTDPTDKTRMSDILAVGAGVIIAGTTGLVWSAAGAMEVPLFAGLLLLGWHVFIDQRAGSADNAKIPFPWGLPIGLAVLTRPEGLLFALLLAVCSRPRVAIINLLLTVLIYAPFGIFCQVVSGRPFPATFYAKTTSTISGLPDISYLAGSAGIIAEMAPPLALVFLVGLAMTVIFLVRNRKTLCSGSSACAGGNGRELLWAIAPGLLFLLALPGAYASMGRTFLFAGGAGNFGRYFYPLLPFLTVLGVLGFSAGFYRRQMRLTALAGLSVILVWQISLTCQRADFYAHNVRDINSMQVEMAHQLSANLPDGSLVAANDVGALAYFTDLRVLDLVGIVSPEVQEAMFPRRGAEYAERVEALFALLMDLRPEAMVVFPSWYPDIIRSLEPVLEPIGVIRVPDNITSASGEMRAYLIQWDRVEG